MKRPRLVNLICEPEHFNPRCNCTIPEAWVAYIEVNGERLPKWPCGDTTSEALTNVKREYPNIKITRHWLQLMNWPENSKQS